jgi:large subunit ribosomal protein L24e
MPACSFCKKQYENPRGLTIFTFDGRSIYYCSSKCRRNSALGRDPKKVNWVKRERKEKGKKVVVVAKKDRKEMKKEVKEDKKEEKKVEGKSGKKIKEEEKVEKKKQKKEQKEEVKKEMIEEEEE